MVFTNGCFDILHVGHVRYLQASKSLGQSLVVGLNSDESVKSLKGPKRPVNTLADRAEMLLSLRWVDAVVPFHESTPQRLIEAISPDILTKGQDYEGKEVVGSDWVIQHGGKVVLLPFIKGYSTTHTLQQINQTP